MRIAPTDVPTRRRGMQSGFTLIELMVVIAIIGILAGIAVVNVKFAQTKAREAALRHDLHEMRKAIDDYYADKQHYPASLAELQPKYLRNIPKDPITMKSDWEEIPEDTNETADDNGGTNSGGGATDAANLQPGIVDVKSRAKGKTLDNVSYHDL
jgi:general secretion pathway protein G